MAIADADDATIRRARGWAMLRALGLIGIGQKWEHGLPGDKQTWRPAGWAALERAPGLRLSGRPGGHAWSPDQT